MGKKSIDNTVNIKALPIRGHIGACKYVNDDWGTVAFSFPRDQIMDKFTDIELQYNCIYFLIGYKGVQEEVYVGQAKKRNNGGSVLNRLREHFSNTSEKYYNHWHWVIVVTNKDYAWGLDDLNALEYEMCNSIPVEQRLNGNIPNSGGIDSQYYEDKVKQIKSYITAAGFSLFADSINSNQINLSASTEGIHDTKLVKDLHNWVNTIPEVITPNSIVNEMLDNLPDSVWNDETVFMDLACKGGEYLKAIFDRLMKTEFMMAKYPSDLERSLHILKKQLYGIALSKISFDRTSKKLMGFDDNLRIIDKYTDMMKYIAFGQKYDMNPIDIRNIISEGFGKDMKIDVVVGNPPYQELISTSEGNKSASKQLFPAFIVNAINMADIVSLITPSRWFSGDDVTSSFVRLREFLKGNNHISRLTHFDDASAVFKGVNIKGGVNYFLYDKGYTGDVEFITVKSGKKSTMVRPLFFDDMDVVIRDGTDINVIRKVKDSNFESFSSIVSGYNPFGIYGKESTIEEIVLNSLVEDIELRCKGNTTYRIDSSFVVKSEDMLDKYKVFISKSSGDPANDKKVIGKPYIGGPRTACSGSLILAGGFDNEEEAVNVWKYMQTKFLRYLVSLIKISHSVFRGVYDLVPMQSFTSKSDIDWSKSVLEIDQQLYKKYNLNAEEIENIENRVEYIQM